MAQAKRRHKPRLVVPAPAVELDDEPLPAIEPMEAAELPRFMRPVVEGQDAAPVPAAIPAERAAPVVVSRPTVAPTAPAVRSSRVRMLRGGVTSEHGQHEAGTVVDTVHAALFIERGWAEPA